MQPAARRRARSGFSLFEAVIAAAILVVLGAAIVPTVVAYQDQKRIDYTAEELRAIGRGVFRFEQNANVATYPGSLEDLYKPIAVASNTPCFNPSVRTYSNEGGTVAKWNVGGPYYHRVVPPTGLRLGVGTANTIFTRTSTNTYVGHIYMTIPSVTLSDALALNDAVDGPGDDETGDQRNLTGALRWIAVPDASDNVSLRYYMPVGNTC